MSGERERETDDSLVCVIEWTSSTVRGVVYLRKCIHACTCVYVCAVTRMGSGGS